MTLHTVMPLEAVWEKQGEADPSAEVRIQGMLMEVRPLDFNRVQIIRLLDGPLDNYLNPAYAPGQIIQYIPAP
ncbi:YlzJ-like family protein [Paenibacillus dokdonensis]|uniref:YlzJ-like family protein n=1 Tax=Paenibacillus dokdonensis TaxID=2567944 RepID=A0ABU6GL39_9BACL|nr:YlzJ-like family protein [Paenibacillus dokdonensis]MEC0240470.1 YlzJ-like family protein [Paenibacillus dokdonensis]